MKEIKGAVTYVAPVDVLLTLNLKALSSCSGKFLCNALRKVLLNPVLQVNKLGPRGKT